MRTAPPETESDRSTIALIADILTDARTLLAQEIELAKHEFRNEVRTAASALVSLAAGIGIAVFGVLLLMLMLVHLLKAGTDLPLWACYGIVGGLLAGVAVMLVALAVKRFKGIHLVPVRTVETLKENIQWFKELATSSRM
jgi:carbon starvation protein CstA